MLKILKFKLNSKKFIMKINRQKAKLGTESIDSLKKS
jgi:hypothetical protein